MLFLKRASDMLDAEQERVVKRLTATRGEAEARKRSERPESHTEAFLVPPGPLGLPAQRAPA